VLRSLLLKFLEAGCGSGETTQVLNLGAGFDTSYFQLAQEGSLNNLVTYFELDFKDVTRRKAAILERTPILKQWLRQQYTEEKCIIDSDLGQVHSDHYRLQPCDLRNLQQVEAALNTSGFDFSKPTFVLAECVLVYMKKEEGAGLLSLLGARLATAVIAIFEQVQPNSPFGQQMVRNLAERGCPLLGIVDSLDSHAKRLIDAGWDRAEARSMRTLYTRSLDPDDRRRAEGLEILDEFEEWNILQDHYCVALGVIDGTGILQAYKFP